MTGLFFCLAPAEGAGLLFCPVAIQPHTSVYSVFHAVNAVIQPTPQNSAQSFTGDFPAIRRVLQLLYGGVSSYAVQPARRWRTHQRTNRLYQYQITPPRRTLYRSAQPPYYNKVYKSSGAPCYRSMPDGAAYRRPCQPGGVLILPTPGGWSHGTGLAWHYPGTCPALCFSLT